MQNVVKRMSVRAIVMCLSLSFLTMAIVNAKKADDCIVFTSDASSVDNSGNFGRNSLLVIDSESAHSRILVKSSTNNGNGFVKPTVSDNGSRIVYIGGAAGVNSHIMTVNFVNSQTVVIDGFGDGFNSIGPLIGNNPSISNDGKQLVFTDPDKTLLWTDGITQKRLFQNVDEARWSPDNQYIAFVSDGTSFMMNADGSGVKSISPKYLAINGISWSPDGSRIAISAKKGNRSRIWLVDVNGRNQREVAAISSDTEFDDLSPGWSPDGRYIVFVRNTRYSSNGIHVMDINGGSLKYLTTGNSPVWVSTGNICRK